MTAPEMKSQSKEKSKGKGGDKKGAKGVKGAKKASPANIGAKESVPSNAQGTVDADVDSTANKASPKGAQATEGGGRGAAGPGAGVGAGAGAGLSCACMDGAPCASCGKLTQQPAAAAGEVTCCAKCSAAQGKRLLRAAHDGCAKEVRQLLQDGADPNFTCDNDWNALHRAVANGHAEAAAALLKGGAAVEATTRGFSALHLAAHHDRSGRCAFLLVAAGADANRATAHGRTPLHYAAEAGNVAALQELLAAGACRTAKDAKGWTPADVAKNATVRKILHKL